MDRIWEDFVDCDFVAQVEREEKQQSGHEQPEVKSWPLQSSNKTSVGPFHGCLKEGDLVIIPKGVDHLPVADDEVQVLLFEPKATVNTRKVKNEPTVARAERI